MTRHLMICFIVLHIMSANLLAASDFFQQHSTHNTEVYSLYAHEHPHNHSSTEHKHGHSHNAALIDFFIVGANNTSIVDYKGKNYYDLKHWLINSLLKEPFRPPIV